MATSPLTGSRYPTTADSPNGPQQIQNAVLDLEDNTIPRFTSTALRDTAYTTWVANGGAMVNGLFCAVGTTLYQYRSGAWGIVPTDYETKMMSARRITNTAGFPTGSSWTSFSDNTNWTEVDPWGMRGSGGVLTCVWTGWYDMSATIWWNNNATGYRSLGFLPSGGLDLGEGAGNVLALDQRDAVTGGVDTIMNGSHKFLATAGATVTLQGRQNSGASLTVNRVSVAAAYLGPNT